MPDQDMPRLVMVVPNWDGLDRPYRAGNFERVGDALKDRMRSQLEHELTDGELRLATDFRVDYLASNGTRPVGLAMDVDRPRRLLVCGVVMTGGERGVEILARKKDGKTYFQHAYGDDAGIGADVGVCTAGVAEMDRFWTHWCPGEAPYGLLGKRAAALRAMGASPQDLADAGFPAAGALADRVNLIMVDTGLPFSMIRPIGTFLGWKVTVEYPTGTVERMPGEPLTDHGAMVAGNALAVALAPGIRVLDCPAIPDGIMDLKVFLGSIVDVIESMADSVALLKAGEAQDGLTPRSWVVCNAWGVFDPGRESPAVPYSNNADHPLTKAFRRLSQLGVDIVFAAGNCGQFCPNGRCGPGFIGPGGSINGSNAMHEALTVGAVRSDRLWLGYSGQGPGIAGMAPEKPDVCAPSQFENDDDAGSNTGTSAACGLAAGAVALLRTKWPAASTDPKTPAATPARLRDVLRSTAVQPYGPKGWQSRTGHGVINIAAAVGKLP